ncbi:MAG: Uncharacterized protein XE01_0642 [Synergistales bacterium 58_81]|nr:MAG: Uncharacterized protein XD83_1317 [Synergistales bacterium 57_84]KUK88337.1 MAG: Uncharacterized protein XE01_0642 [Synergistales bacterium 58_81]
MRGFSGKFLLLLLVVSVLFTTCIRPGQASAQMDAAALTKAIQSIALMTVETSGGFEVSGLAFVSLGENRAVTALRLLKDARKVTLKFQSGEEVSSAGIVDVDEKRGIALIDLPEHGRKMLDIAQVKITPGTVVNCAAARDGAFGFIRLSVSEAHQGTDGVERYILSGEAFSGNSGTPALDVNGNVIGMVIELESTRILVPSAFIIALDPSLPLRPWETQGPTSATAGPSTQGTSPMDAIDSSILEFLILRHDHQVIYHWADEITGGHGYLQGVPQDLYNFQTKLEVALRRIKDVQTDDPSRSTLLKNLLEAGANQHLAAEHMMKAIVVGQQTNVWGPQSQDLQKRSKAALAMTEEILASQNPILREIYGGSSAFRENMPKELVYSLTIEPRPSLFRLGVQTPVSNPLYLSVVYQDSFAVTLGLKPGDRLISAAGTDLDPKGSMEEFKMIVQNNLGKTIPVTVEREGKKTELKMSVPKEIPSSFLY